MLTQERKLGKKATMVMGALRPETPPTSSRWRWGLAAGLALVLLGAAAAYRVQHKGHAGSETTHEEAVRSVSVVYPEQAAAAEVVLPATLQPNQATDLYPRVEGFVKAWRAEIGSAVRAGQLLAEIDAPELDQEVRRAEAQTKQGEADLQQSRAELDEAKADVALAASNLERAKANLELATSQGQRVRRLYGTRSASREEYDRAVSEQDVRASEVRAAEADAKKRDSTLATRDATIRSREATLAVARANLQRLRELQGFKRIVAPFDGVVSRRQAEVGVRVAASAGRPLFRVVQTDLLRVQLDVPQAFAALVRPGDAAGVSVPESSGRAFPAKVARTAGEIDPASRTVTVELELPNAGGELLPGTYAQVTIAGRRADGALLVPGSAVLMRPEGPRVAVVSGGEARLRAVELGRDRGGKVEVLAGLAARDLVVTNPTDDLGDGRKVEAVGPAPTPVASR